MEDLRAASAGVVPLRPCVRRPRRDPHHDSGADPHRALRAAVPGRGRHRHARHPRGPAGGHPLRAWRSRARSSWPRSAPRSTRASRSPPPAATSTKRPRPPPSSTSATSPRPEGSSRACRRPGTERTSTRPSKHLKGCRSRSPQNARRSSHPAQTKTSSRSSKRPRPWNSPTSMRRSADCPEEEAVTVRFEPRSTNVKGVERSGPRCRGTDRWNCRTRRRT